MLNFTFDILCVYIFCSFSSTIISCGKSLCVVLKCSSVCVYAYAFVCKGVWAFFALKCIHVNSANCNSIFSCFAKHLDPGSIYALFSSKCVNYNTRNAQFLMFRFIALFSCGQCSPYHSNDRRRED